MDTSEDPSLFDGVVVAVVAFGIFMALLFGKQDPDGIRAHTEKQAKAWAYRQHFDGFVSPTCQRFETRGYIRCDVAVESPRGTSVYRVLCAAPFTFNSGCKLVPGRTFQ